RPGPRHQRLAHRADAGAFHLRGRGVLMKGDQQQPSPLAAQAAALFRQGREDLLNTLNGVPLAREMGAPGEPTPQLVTRALEKKGQEAQDREPEVDMDR